LRRRLSAHRLDVRIAGDPEIGTAFGVVLTAREDAESILTDLKIALSPGALGVVVARNATLAVLATHGVGVVLDDDALAIGLTADLGAFVVLTGRQQRTLRGLTTSLLAATLHADQVAGAVAVVHTARKAATVGTRPVAGTLRLTRRTGETGRHAGAVPTGLVTALAVVVLTGLGVAGPALAAQLLTALRVGVATICFGGAFDAFAVAGGRRDVVVFGDTGVVDTDEILLAIVAGQAIFAAVALLVGLGDRSIGPRILLAATAEREE
jgi:hypothetical protein